MTTRRLYLVPDYTQFEAATLLYPGDTWSYSSPALPTYSQFTVDRCNNSNASLRLVQAQVLATKDNHHDLCLLVIFQLHLTIDSNPNAVPLYITKL